MSSALDKVEENIFKLISNDIKDNQTLSENQIYNGFGCNGKNVSPDLTWINPPINTKSYAIIAHDPDAPKENGWYHWLVINIPQNVKFINQGGKIAGSIETITDFNSYGYDGACPPVGNGEHRYNFTINALNVEKLDLNNNTKPYLVEKEVLAHTIAKSTLTGLYERK